jgi:hypothetical protein
MLWLVRLLLPVVLTLVEPRPMTPFRLIETVEYEVPSIRKLNGRDADETPL